MATTIILGGGIIGLSVAYFLAELEPLHQIHIIDTASELLLSASGSAGGFVALDWFSPPVASLGELSFRLHKELAAQNDGQKNWSYTKSIAYSLAIDSRGVAKKEKSGRDVWLQTGASRADAATIASENGQARGEGAERNEVLNDDGTPAWFTKQKNGTLEVIDDQGGCAQVVPRQLCEFLLQACEARGVKIHTGCEATGIFRQKDGKIGGIKVKKDCEIFEKHCNNIVLAAGAWTPHAFSTLFSESKLKIPVQPLAGYSITVRSPRLSQPILDPASSEQNSALSHALYCAPTSSWDFAPEVFSRIGVDGRPELWAGGLNEPSLNLPKTADGVVDIRDSKRMEDLKRTMIAMAGTRKEGHDLNIDDLEVVKQGLCFRPVSSSGYPIITRIPDKSIGKDFNMEDGGVFCATGHGPWGISLSLGTGRVMAELITHRATSANISRLKIS